MDNFIVVTVNLESGGGRISEMISEKAAIHRYKTEIEIFRESGTPAYLSKSLTMKEKSNISLMEN